MRYLAIVTSVKMKETKECEPRPDGHPYWCDNPLGRGELVRSSEMRRKEPKTIKGEVHWRCSRCKRWKLEIEFGRVKKQWNGINTCCGECLREVDGRRRKRNRKHLVECGANGYRQNRESERIRSARFRAKNAEKIRRKSREYKRKNPQKTKAQTAVGNAVQSGRLIRPERCEMCGVAERLNGHHDSYKRDRWLVVVWLCRPCHAFLHVRQDELRQGATG